MADILRTNSIEARDNAGMAYYGLSQCAARRRDDREAARCCGQALGQWESIPDELTDNNAKPIIADSCRILAEYAYQNGNYEDALMHANSGYEISAFLEERLEAGEFIKLLDSKEELGILLARAEKCTDIASSIAIMRGDAAEADLWINRRLGLIQKNPGYPENKKQASLALPHISLGMLYAGKENEKSVKLLLKGLNLYGKAVDSGWTGEEEKELVRAGYMAAIAQCQNLGQSSAENGRYEEAFDWFYRSYECLSKFVPEEFTDDSLQSMLFTTYNLADLLETMGRKGDSALFWNITAFTSEELFRRNGDPIDRDNAITCYFAAEDAALENGDEETAAKSREAARKLGAVRK
jgi:tetratricopeptide (TPR) repeat protein